MLTLIALFVAIVAGFAAACCYEEMRLRLFSLLSIVSGVSFILYITGINS